MITTLLPNHAAIDVEGLRIPRARRSVFRPKVKKPEPHHYGRMSWIMERCGYGFS